MSTNWTRRAGRLVVMLACGSVLWGCSGAPVRDGKADTVRPATLWVLLLDRSGSAKADAPIYEDAVRRVLRAVQPGDRFVMAAITGTSGTDFRVSVDHSLPVAMPPQGLMDEPKKYEEEKAKIEKEVGETRRVIEGDAERFLRADSNAARSAIFESLLVVAPLIAADQRRRVLVLLSDMLEESASSNFDRTPPTDAFTKKEIERQRSAHTLPDLKGLTVCVAGAVASPPERAAAVERFWRTYLESSGATLGPGAYARTLTRCVE